MRLLRAVGAALGALLLGATMSFASARATPVRAEIVGRTIEGPQRQVLYVYSVAMDRVIPMDVILPRDRSPAPILYLLNGAGGGEDAASWAKRTDYVRFFADKHVTVVTPMRGAYSYYTDWWRDDPRLGRQKWQTFLTRELPPLLDAAFGATGANALAGISMAGTSVLNLAEAAPGLYRAVASYSGCARTSDPLGQAYVRAVVELLGGADAENMWGPLDGPGWRENDPYVNADRLRGTAVYLSTGTGVPGPDEALSTVTDPDSAMGLFQRIVYGGGIEVAVNVCTQQMARRLRDLHIPATVHIRPTGTHSWGYWERDLKDSWPMLWAAMNR